MCSTVAEFEGGMLMAGFAMDDSEESAVAGTIKVVTMKNFMCHKNLKIEFGPSVNFIVGPNGSGKSAVVAAIKLALGSKVSSHVKCSNLWKFIKAGCPNAVVSVTLKNEGSDAYKPDVYGNSIIVERKIQLDNSSQYRIKSSSGCVISSKKDDLLDILKEFNIAVENPITILTQEVSKNFLNSRKQTEKYELFYKATQMESLKRWYMQAQKAKNGTCGILENKEISMKILKKELHALKQTLHEVDSLKDKKNELEELKKEHLWAIVKETENFVEVAKNDVKLKEDSVKILSEKLQQAEEEYKENLEKEASVKKDWKAMQERAEGLKSKSGKLLKLQRKCKEIIRESEASLNKCCSDISIAEVYYDSLKRNIESSTGQTAGKEDKRTESAHKRLKEMEERRNLKEKLDVLRQSLPEKETSLTSILSKLNTTPDNLISQKYKLDTAKKEAQDLEKCLSNELMAYGGKVPMLVERIDKESKLGNFRLKPIGPIGHYVKVKDPQWELAVEACLGTKLLHSFLCDNVVDQELLFKIMLEMYCKETPQVITCHFEETPYDISSDEVQSKRFCSVPSMLIVSNPQVFNCLVDQRGIEGILLIPNDAEAREIMLFHPPPKCMEVYTLGGTCFHPSPMFRQYTNAKKAVSLISRNIANDLDGKRKEVEELKSDLTACEEELKFLHHEKSELQSSILKVKYDISATEAQLQRLDSNTAESDICEDFEVAFPPEQDLKQKEKDLDTLRDKKSKLLEVIRKYTTEHKLYEKEYAECNNELKKLPAASVIFAHLCTPSPLEQNTLERKLKEESEKLQFAMDTFKEKLARAEQAIGQAEKLCPRIETNRKPNLLNAERVELESIINRTEQEMGNFEEISGNYSLKLSEYRKVCLEVQKLNVLSETYDSAVKQRLATFENIRTCISLRVTSLFIANMHSRGFVAKMKLDHNSRSMELSFKTAEDSRKYPLSDKSLSGGEKSFATVGLLLALWDAVEIPFRILDEYDVFMDQANRRRSMDLMIHTAREQSSKQFVFLSPLELTIYSSSKMNIFRMPSPERKEVEEYLEC